ncbi:hypothetical protein BLA17378_04656 [Burkholderia aenigmatica]|uniref:Uncharacterized protein n=1 Tax=Burkholderia aenigmatica TaxID=2015348 RepID=A0ABY6XXB2_9BURK|nr:hypothetical protein BLA17378_04656 [Burkholderia aenigmatica]VWD42762.1 hypothetical protein BLA18628_05451 [Burkholderia aenigmatica]
MGIQKTRRPHDSQFDWERFSRFVIDSYGGFESPNYSFVKLNFSLAKYPDVIRFLEGSYDFSEDTEPNSDVSYGYLLKGGADDFVLRMSLVGPYYYLSSLSRDGSQRPPKIDYPTTNSMSPLIRHMERVGMIFTPVDVLNKRFAFGSQCSSTYSIIYCYGDEPSWIQS